VFSVLLFLYLCRLPPSPTLFPYTTLFRSACRDSRPARRRCQGGQLPVARAGAICHARALRDVHGRDAACAPGARGVRRARPENRSEEHTSELQSRENLVCRLLLEKKKRVS